MTQVLEGTWEEIREQAEEAGRRSGGRHLKLVFTEEPTDPLAPDGKPPTTPGDPPHFRNRQSAWNWLIEARNQISEEWLGHIRPTPRDRPCEPADE